MTKNHPTFVFAIYLLGGCGDSGFSTGLPPSKSLGTLNPDQANKLCASTASYVQTKATMTTCQLEADLAGFAQGKTDTDARMICKTKLNECLAAAKSSATGGSANTGCKPPPASCMATVGEYEACLNDLSGAYDKTLAGLPNCETLTLTLSGLPSSRPPAQTPASCSTAQQKCLGFSISGGASSSTPPKQ